MEKEKNFIDFILEAQEDEELTKSFIEADTPKKLEALFVSRGYDNLSGQCDKIIQARGKYGEVFSNLGEDIIDIIVGRRKY